MYILGVLLHTTLLTIQIRHQKQLNRLSIRIAKPKITTDTIDTSMQKKYCFYGIYIIYLHANIDS